MYHEILRKIENREAKICVVGLGYVGLPLAITFAKREFKVLGYDTNWKLVNKIRSGDSGQRHIVGGDYLFLLESGMLRVDTVIDSDADVYIVCVPTPLTENREPDLQYVKAAMETIEEVLRPGNLVVLESTTYPGTTSGVVREILEEELEAGKDFFLVYSPERQDPGNEKWTVENTPKVVGGITDACRAVGKALYEEMLINEGEVVSVKNTETAEMVKLFENIYRTVNIALVNELKLLCHRLGMSVWEVVEAAASKPFGFHSFKPGPGLGGHCLPVDPFYLTWRARQVNMSTKFVELAGEINSHMPYFVVERVVDALNSEGRSVKGSNIAILGMAYKKNVSDLRESPAFKIFELLHDRGASVFMFDPLVEPDRKYDEKLGGR